MNINMNPNSELVQSFVKVPDMVQVPDILVQQAFQFQEAMMMYTCAIREAKTKLEVLNDELSVRNKRTPIEMIKSRVKKPVSIVEKLQRRGLEISVQSMMDNLDDVAGIRVICSFVDDIYQVAEMLVRQDDVRVIAIKDYIKNPKDNGYRSYHMIVNYEVQTIYGIKRIPVEIQIRTMAMNFWATIEHSLQYKYKGNVPEHIRERLSSSAEAVLSLDSEMSSIREEVMAAQQLFREKANVVADILNNIQALYRSENKEAMLNIQDEFYNLYKTGTLEELEDFCSRLDAIAARRNVQKLN